MNRTYKVTHDISTETGKQFIMISYKITIFIAIVVYTRGQDTKTVGKYFLIVLKMEVTLQLALCLSEKSFIRNNWLEIIVTNSFVNYETL